jgi:hypothetical protein
MRDEIDESSIVSAAKVHLYVQIASLLLSQAVSPTDLSPTASSTSSLSVLSPQDVR